MTSATENRTTELLLDMLYAFLVDYQNILKAAISEEISEKETITRQRAIAREHAERIEQAIAAMPGDDDYEAKMDALLCRLTNGKWSKTRSYDLDFMESCVREEIEEDIAKDTADVYAAGFDNGVKACLHVIDGYLAYPYSAAENIQRWVDKQWREYES